MPLYPDLNACGIAYMQLSFHVGGGLEAIDAFWEQRGHKRGFAERLLFASYTRSGKPHTVWLQWTRSHVTCADVYLGLEARRPANVWPRRPLKTYRLREADLRKFFALIQTEKVPQGMLARYAYPWDKSLDAMLHLPPNTRATSLSMDVLDENRQPAMNLTYERRGKEWLAVVVPVGRYRFDAEPVTDDFFKDPYDVACILGESLRQKRLEPL